MQDRNTVAGVHDDVPLSPIAADRRLDIERIPPGIEHDPPANLLAEIGVHMGEGLFEKILRPVGRTMLQEFAPQAGFHILQDGVQDVVIDAPNGDSTVAP